MKSYISYIFESKKLKTDISEFDLDKMIEQQIYHYNDDTPDIIELLLIMGGNIKKDSLYSAVVKPNHYEETRIRLAEILIKKGNCNVNEKIYLNGIYKSITCLSMICSSGLSGNDYKNYNVIAKLIELGGDMSIKDNFNKSAYDYLTEKDVISLSKKITNFKYDYELYMKSDKYNL